MKLIRTLSLQSLSIFLRLRLNTLTYHVYRKMHRQTDRQTPGRFEDFLTGVAEAETPNEEGVWGRVSGVGCPPPHRRWVCERRYAPFHSKLLIIFNENDAFLCILICVYAYLMTVTGRGGRLTPLP